MARQQDSLHPPAAPAAPSPDPKLVAAQARAQLDQATATRQAQIAQQKAQNDAIHLQVKAQTEIQLAIRRSPRRFRWRAD